MTLNNQVVLITGASSGIGQDIAYEVASRQANVVLVARRKERLEQLSQELKARYGSQVLVIEADLSQSSAIERVVADTIQYFGRIDILMSGAGYGQFTSALQVQYEDIVRQFQVNTFAMMYLAKLVSLQMLEQQEGGKIYFIASIAGKISTPNASVYGATKAAMISYANALRLELKSTNISVTTVNPGPVETEFFAHNVTMQSYFHKVKQWSLDSQQLAHRIVATMSKKRPPREINTPNYLNLASKFVTLFPNVSDYMIKTLFNYKEE